MFYNIDYRKFIHILAGVHRKAKVNTDLDFIQGLAQDDPLLIQIIRNWFLEEPPGNKVGYNFQNKNPNLNGQVGQPPIIDNILKSVRCRQSSEAGLKGQT